MKPKLTQEEFYDWWLEKYFGINVKWLIENEPELIKTPAWYKKYAVTKEQHDEWYEWAVQRISKYYRYSRKTAERFFAFDYLNVSPTIKTAS
jgi:hypothetical protein